MVSNTGIAPSSALQVNSSYYALKNFLQWLTAKKEKKSIKYYVIFKRELELFCRNTSVVVFMYLGKKNKIKPVEENFQTKALVYFT